MAGFAERRFGTGIWPWLLLITGAFVISTNHVLGRYVIGDIPPMGLAFWRVAIGALVMLPFAWRDLKANWPTITRHWKLFTIMAVALMPMGNAMVYLAYNFTTAINGSIILTAQPALTVVFAWVILNYTINAKQAVGIGVAAVGVLIIILRGDPATLATLSFGAGDLIMLVGTTAFAVYTVLVRRVPAEIGPMLILVIIQLFGAASLAPFYLIESLTYRPVPLTAESLLVIAWVGTAIAVVAVGLNNMVVLFLGPAKASIGHYLRALFTTAMAIALLGEALETFHFVAFALVIVGVVLMSRGRTPAPRTAR